MSARLVAGVVLLVGMAAAMPARAEDPRSSRLEVVRGLGAEACPDAATLADAVNAALGRPELTTARAPAETTFVLELTREPRGFVAVLRANGARRGERRVEDEGTSCRGLAEAITTTLAILLEPRSPAVTLAVPEPSPPNEDDLPPESERPRFAITPAVSPLRIDLAAGVALGEGLLPRTAAGFRGLVRFRGAAPLSIAAGFVSFAEQARVIRPGSVTVSLAAASLVGCWLLVDRTTLPRAGVCLEPMGGALRGSGRGFETAPRSVTRPWLAVAVGGHLDGDLVGPFGWTVSGAALAPLTREKLAISGFGLVHDPPAIAFQGTLAIRATLR